MSFVYISRAVFVHKDAPEAVKLYQETEESIEKNQALAAQRKALGATAIIHDSRPTKKQRRKIHQFKQQQNDE